MIFCSRELLKKVIFLKPYKN